MQYFLFHERLPEREEPRVRCRHTGNSGNWNRRDPISSIAAFSNSLLAAHLLKLCKKTHTPKMKMNGDDQKDAMGHWRVRSASVPIPTTTKTKQREGKEQMQTRRKCSQSMFSPHILYISLAPFFQSCPPPPFSLRYRPTLPC